MPVRLLPSRPFRRETISAGSSLPRSGAKTTVRAIRFHIHAVTLNVAVIAGGVAMISAAGRRLLRCRQADLLSAVLIGVHPELNRPMAIGNPSAIAAKENNAAGRRASAAPSVGYARDLAFTVTAFLLFLFLFFFFVLFFLIRIVDLGEFQHG